MADAHRDVNRWHHTAPTPVGGTAESPDAKNLVALRINQAVKSAKLIEGPILGCG
jgi:hypothetical protein